MLGAFGLVVSLLVFGWALPVLAADPILNGFNVEDITDALNQPVAFGFTEAGRLFVAEKRGTVQSFDSVGDPTPTQVIDVRAFVHDYWDRGLLGLAVDPAFGAGSDYLYLLYTVDPGWGDTCLYPTSPPQPPFTAGNPEDPEGAAGCVVNARLSRFLISGNSAGPEDEILAGNWCAQFPSHTIGDLAFTGEGNLLVSAGDGASFSFADHGQVPTRSSYPLGALDTNACDDPMGSESIFADDEGGALRSQDLRESDDPVSYDGTVLRVNKETGAPAPGNPTSEDSRIVAYGLRNPFRLTIHPTTGEIWLGDVGMNTWEEINRFFPEGSTPENFGWPCYEGSDQGSAPNPDYAGGLDLCENLYEDGASAVVAPHYARSHNDPAGCTGSGGALSGLAFYEGGRYPDEFDGALFIADYSINCVRVMFPDASGNPDPDNVDLFINDAFPVDLQIGPGGDLYYADIVTGRIVRVNYNTEPVADITASSLSGGVPFEVSFNGLGSSDGEGDPLDYAWDLDGDGQFDDSAASEPTATYTVANVVVTVRLRVTDPGGLSHTDSIVINPVDHQATITDPLAGFAWQPGQEISFGGDATDASTGSIPTSALTWNLILLHCDSVGCHPHEIESFAGVSSGSFIAPDHPHPTQLLIRLTATDSNGHTDVVEVVSAIGGTQSGGGGGGGGAGGGGAQEALFDDVPSGHAFFAEINWLAGQRITLGCTDDTFCPEDPVTRGQMAVFLARALALLPAPSGLFTDTTGSPYEWAISSVAAAGITQGCAVDRYCPNDAVTREQMASFLVRAFLFPAGDDLFTDDDDSVHERDINALANSGVTVGCALTLYCSQEVVTREQMAAFLFRSFNS